VSDAADLSGLRRQPEAGSRHIVPPPVGRWKTRVLLPAGILILFLLLLAYAGRDALQPRLDVRVVPVVVAKGGEASGVVAFQAAGWVEPDPYPIYVTALADGVIEEVLVLEGQRVEKDQVVARLVKDDARIALDAAEAHVRDQDAQVARAKARLEAAQRDWDNPVERRRAVDSAQASVAEAKAALTHQAALVEVQEGRVAELTDQLRREEGDLPQEAISEAEVVRTRLRLATAKSTLTATRAKEDVLQAQLAGAEADLVAAKENLRLRIEETLELETSGAELDRVNALLAKARAERDDAALRLERMDVRSPAAGVVMKRLSEPGAKKMLAMDDFHSAHVLHLYDPQRLQVRVDVPLADAAGLGVGLGAEIVVEVLPNRTFGGEVTRLVHEADIQKNTLQAKVAIRDPVPELKPEMLARVRFLAPASADGAQEAQHVFAPERLLERNGSNRARVWIVDKGAEEARKREVTLGTRRRDGWVEVVSGLRQGDVVIDAEQDSLDDGRKVRIVGESEE
jgi:RND family efflux transporter MFP subunit